MVSESGKPFRCWMTIAADLRPMDAIDAFDMERGKFETYRTHIRGRA